MIVTVCWFHDDEYSRWTAEGETEEELAEAVELVVLVRGAESYWLERDEDFMRAL